MRRTISTLTATALLSGFALLGLLAEPAGAQIPDLGGDRADDGQPQPTTTTTTAKPRPVESVVTLRHAGDIPAGRVLYTMQRRAWDGELSPVGQLAVRRDRENSFGRIMTLEGYPEHFAITNDLPAGTTVTRADCSGVTEVRHLGDAIDVLFMAGSEVDCTLTVRSAQTAKRAPEPDVSAAQGAESSPPPPASTQPAPADEVAGVVIDRASPDTSTISNVEPATAGGPNPASMDAGFAPPPWEQNPMSAHLASQAAAAISPPVAAAGAPKVNEDAARVFIIIIAGAVIFGTFIMLVAMRFQSGKGVHNQRGTGVIPGVGGKNKRRRHKPPGGTRLTEV